MLYYQLLKSNSMRQSTIVYDNPKQDNSLQINKNTQSHLREKTTHISLAFVITRKTHQTKAESNKALP